MSLGTTGLVLIVLTSAAQADSGATKSSLSPSCSTGITLEDAQTDLADARAYLSDLEAGDFAGIYGVADDGSLRCGETEANQNCAPLTELDKTQALSEAGNLVRNAKARLAEVGVGLASCDTCGILEN